MPAISTMINIAMWFSRCGNRAVSRIQLLPVDNPADRRTGALLQV